MVLPDGAGAVGAIVRSGGAAVPSTEDGVFTIPVLPASSAQLVTATTRDRKRSGQTTVLVNQAGQTATGALITLSGLGAAEFTVLDASGQALPGRTVKLLDSLIDPCGRSTATTDGLGRARFSDLGLGLVTGQVVNQGEVRDAARASISISGDGQTGFGILRVETRSSSVTGVVVDAANQPVFGADIELRSSAYVEDFTTCGMQTIVTHRARTGLDGRFSFSGVHPGRVYVSASQSFFPTPVSKTVDLQPGQSAAVTLTLVDTISGEISGNVFEPDGTTSAGPGVEVTLNGALPDVTVFTDAAGHFRFAKIFPAGSYRLTARDPITGLLERATIYIAAGVDAVHDVRLKGKATVRVKVTDALAQKVSQAYVTLKETAFPNRTFEGAVASSNEGVVEFPGVFEGAVSIEVRDSFGRGGRSSLTIPIGIEVVEAVVRISTTGTIRGRFKMPDGLPIPLGGLKLLAGGRLIGQVTASADDPPGAFEFTYVPSGAFRIEALDPLTGRTGIATGTSDAEGQVVEIDVLAQSIGTVSGLVTSNGAPMAGVNVDLLSGAYSARTTTDSNGGYVVRGVPEGWVVVNAYTGTGFLRASNAGTLQGEGASLALDVALRGTGSISGRVFKAGGETGAGVVGVSLYVGGVGGGSITGSTGVDGTFSFDRVPVGLAQIEVDALGSDDFAAGTFEVVVGEETPVSLTLNGIGDLHGRGLDSSGAATSGRMTIQVGPPQRRRSYTIDLAAADGRFELPHVLAGAFTATLTVTNGGLTLYGTGAGQIVDSQLTEIDVRLQDSATVTGRVFRADGVTPAYGATATLQTAALASASAQAQPDGTFTFRGVTLGAFTVKVSDPITTGLARAGGTLTANGQSLNLGDLTLDDSPIQVLAVSPADGAVGVLVNQAVAVTFTDPLSSTGGVQVLNGTSGVSATPTLSADGRVVTLIPTSTWPDARALTVRANTSVTDVFGRHPAQTFTSQFVTQDLSPPTVLSLVPANLAIQVDPNAAITVTFSEPLSAAADLATLVTLKQGTTVLPGLAALVAPNQVQFVPAQPLSMNASFSVSVNGARDLTGNTQTVPFQSSFKSFDTIAPIVGLASPATGGWTTNRRPPITVTLTDALSGIDAPSGLLAIDGVEASPVRSAASMTFTPGSDLVDGQHSVAASVLDRAANLGSLAALFGVDATPPLPAEITAGVAAGGSVSGTITLAATSSDGTSGLAKIEILEGATVRATLLPPSFSLAYNTNSLAEGSHTFVARAVDVAGNVGALGAPISFFVDNHVLTLAITSPANGLRIKDSVAASATTSETVSRVAFTIGATTFEDAVSPYSATLDTSALVEGNYTLTVTAWALTGEPTIATVSVFVDRTPPFDPVVGLLSADDQGNGLAQVVGRAGAIVGGSQVEARRVGMTSSVLATVAIDGSFATRVSATEGDFVELRALDSVENASQWLPIQVIRSTNADGIPLTGIALWVKADAGVTADASGLVSSWADQSGNENHLAQTSATKRPARIVDGFNGYPVVRFDGNSDVLSFTNAIPDVGTVFFVVKEDSSANSVTRRTLLSSTTSPGDFRGGNQATATSVGTIWDVTVASARVKSGTTYVNGVPVDGTVFSRPRTMSVISLTTASGSGTAAASLFGAYNGTGEFWWGDLAEMIVYERALNDSERAQVELYLAQKYHPYPAATSTPQIAPAGGVFDGSTTVSLYAQPGAIIYYTLDGTDPTQDPFKEYSGPFTISATTTVRARAFKVGLDPSQVAAATFIESARAPVPDHMALWVRSDAGLATDVANPTVWADQSGHGNHLTQTEGTRLPLLVRDASNGLPAMHFDGDSDFLKFTKAIPYVGTAFFVVKEDSSANSVTRRTLLSSTTSPGDFRGGNQATATSVGTIWDVTVASARVRNGSTNVNGVPVDGTTFLRPRTMSVISLTTTSGSGTAAASLFGAYNGTGEYWWGDLAELIIYDQPLSSEQRAQVEGYLTAKYAIGEKVVAPVVSPNGGLFPGEVSVTMSTPTLDADIYYTLNGSDPTPSSDHYTEPFMLSATTTVKARAFKQGLADSAVTTVGFTKDTDFTPKAYLGLQLWLRADAGVPSGAGDYWADQSGAENHGIQPASASTGILVPNAINGLPVMRFDGNSDFLKFTNALPDVGTVFFVVKEDSSANSVTRRTLLSSTTSPGDFRGGNQATATSVGTIWDVTVASARVRNGSTNVNGVPVDGTTFLRPRTMSVISLTTTSGSGTAAASLFGAYNATGEFWWGDLAELIIYDQRLDAGKRQQVETYLKVKYGIQ